MPACQRYTSTRRRVCCTYPRNQALVEALDATARPDGAHSVAHALGTVGSHLGLDDLEGLAEGGHLELSALSACLLGKGSHLSLTRFMVAPTAMFDQLKPLSPEGAILKVCCFGFGVVGGEREGVGIKSKAGATRVIRYSSSCGKLGIDVEEKCSIGGVWGETGCDKRAFVCLATR